MFDMGFEPQVSQVRYIIYLGTQRSHGRENVGSFKNAFAKTETVRHSMLVEGKSLSECKH